MTVIGMGCTRFGELWDKGVDDLLTDASVPNLELADIIFAPRSTPLGIEPETCEIERRKSDG